MGLAGPDGRPHGYAAVFGRNGSGKTNLVQAFRFLLDSTGTLSRDGGPLPVRESRMLGAEGNMRLGFTFLLGGADAVYSMEFGDGDEIVRESLDIPGDGGAENLFTLSREADGSVSAGFRGSFFGNAEAEASLGSRIADQWGPHTLLSILRHGRSGMEPAICTEAFEALRCLDSVRVCLEGENGVPFDLESGTVGTDMGRMLDAYEGAIAKLLIRTSLDIRDAHYETEVDGDRIRYRLFLERRINGMYRDVEASGESLGTRKLIRLLPYLMDLARGRTVIVDGIDAGIHPELSYLMLDEILGSGKGQLIMTSHNTRLLLELDPEKAYVINQGFMDAKTVVPIASVGGSDAEGDNEERYHNGVFGDIPRTSLIDMEEISGTFDEFMGDARIGTGGQRFYVR